MNKLIEFFKELVEEIRNAFPDHSGEQQQVGIAESYFEDED